MRNATGLAFVSLASLLSAAVFGAGACGGGGQATADAPLDSAVDASPPDAWVMPILHNPVSLASDALGPAALALMRGPSAMNQNCTACHPETRDRYRSWKALSTTASGSCFANLAPTTPAEATAIIDCFRLDPAVPASSFSPSKLGVFATGSGLAWFESLFQLAYGGQGATQWQAFNDVVAMPRGSDHPKFSQEEFDIVLEWFLRDMPGLTTLVAEPELGSCGTTNVLPEVASHVAAQATQGWRAVNQENNLLSLGCGAATNPRDCLTSYPQPATTGDTAGWNQGAPAGTVMRLLGSTTYRSSYWTRSSADGRWVAHGGADSNPQGYASTVIDLTDNRQIPVDALYDPGFFPDNSGFIFQRGSSSRLCAQSVLEADPTAVTLSETGCSSSQAIGLYQHIGGAVGGDYWAIDSAFESDVGNGEPPGTFNANATLDLTPFVHTGDTWTTKPRTRIAVPGQGDAVISPSSKLVITRSRDEVGPFFILYKATATPTSEAYDVSLAEVARYCMPGGKPAFSYDERWMVYHHKVKFGDWADLGYASASDVEFQNRLQSNTVNVYLVEVATGIKHRITHMRPGQTALFPHFRSDGWIYFIVKDASQVERIVASDAALVLED